MADYEAAGLNELVHDLSAAPGRVQRASVGVVEKHSRRVEHDSRRLASGLAHAPLYPQSITHDVTIKAGAVEGEIGPDKSRPQGALGNLLEYGSSKNAPISHLGPALDLAGPDFEDDIGDAGEPW